MKPPRFDYRAVASVEESIALLREHGDEAKVLAGGQSLVPMLSLRLVYPELLVDVCRIDGLDRIDEHEGVLRIGATARQAVVMRSPQVRAAAPLLVQALRFASHPGIRSRGTFGGSIAHADPAAELPAALLALDGSVVAHGPDGDRTIPAEELFETYLTTALEPDELLTEVRIPRRRPGGRAAFLEIARRHGDFALVAVAVAVQCEPDERVASARIVLAGVSDVPVRAHAAEQSLVGERLTDDRPLADAAAEAVAGLDPSDDVHASGRYRREVAGVLVRRALRQCAGAGGAEA